MTIIRNTTIQNRSKQARLAKERKIPRHHVDGSESIRYLRELDEVDAPAQQLLFSVGLALLGEHRTPAIEAFLDDYSFQLLAVPPPPKNTFDLLGSIYQYRTPKAESLAKGSFYTGQGIASDLVHDMEFSNGQTILDPACGSGSLLFESSAGPEQLVGIDNDPTAVMIAKFNYFLKFPLADEPDIHCENFFSWYSNNAELRFDYVVGNPPFGGEVDQNLVPSFYIRSGESFSHFVELGFNLLSQDGMLRYLVPESLLNVTRHTDVRDFLIEETNLAAVRQYSEKFTGVMSDIYSIEVTRSESDTIIFRKGEDATPVSKELVRGVENRVLMPWTDTDMRIVEKVDRLRRFDLRSSIFGLGVVTGDNKSKLLGKPTDGAEPIYTGKEVFPYRLSEPVNFLVFNRSELQQVAPDEIYRAPRKLVYKTISKDLRFALDESGALTVNSANILIPHIPGYSMESVMALLNSDLYSFIHTKLFGGVNKVAKASLQGLPFPELTFEQDETLVGLVHQAQVDRDDELLQTYVNTEVFALSQSEINYIRGSVVRAMRST